MVARLVGAGHDVRVLGRSADKRCELDRMGARAVADMAQVGADADIVVVCVFTDEQLQEVCLAGELLPSIAPGSALVVHTTASPRTIEAIAARAGAVDVVDAAVSGGPHDVAAGQLTLFVGGSQRAMTRVRPALGCYGDPMLRVGPVGAGQKVKLINNALFAAHIGLLAESVRVGERLGVPESALLPALAHGSATSRVLNLIAAKGSVSAFADATGGFVGKDVAVVRDITDELGTDLGALDDAIKALGDALG
ncbi:6-phosphogluconate dehydrogenase [Mycobacterium saskatchewanense]|uniref:6-phosphogluconate dehydrogenase n=1 Tax=Mycobacterium saskatchewanense TaxID=220927 RepID=A0AAJ3NRG3_9MYCO|nr:6-phosphogluconate dehydrogenase [Mycobacterium saskatchewanense]